MDRHRRTRSEVAAAYEYVDWLISVINSFQSKRLIVLDWNWRPHKSHVVDREQLAQRLAVDTETSRPAFSDRLQSQILAAVAKRRLQSVRCAIIDWQNWSDLRQIFSRTWVAHGLFPIEAVVGILFLAVW